MQAGYPHGHPGEPHITRQPLPPLDDLDKGLQTMSFHNLSPQAKKKGLKKAREVKKGRAQLKHCLKNGRHDLQDVFRDKKIFDLACNMKLVELIGSLPGMGKLSAEKLQEKLGISLTKKTGGLGKNQKQKLFDYFGIDP